MSNNAPKPGDPILYQGQFSHFCDHVTGNICYSQADEKTDGLSFIWQFHDGLNTRHEWPGKRGAA